MFWSSVPGMSFYLLIFLLFLLFYIDMLCLLRFNSHIGGKKIEFPFRAQIWKQEMKEDWEIISYLIYFLRIPTTGKEKKKNPNLYISIHLDKRGFEMRGYLIHICWYFMIFYLKDNFKIPVAPAFKCTHIQMRSLIIFPQTSVYSIKSWLCYIQSPAWLLKAATCR